MFSASSLSHSTMRVRPYRPSQGHSTSAESPASFKSPRARRNPAYRRHPYSGAVPHITPSADLEKAERRMRLATLRKLHATLDLRDELEQREEKEVAALAELHVGVTALRESINALERRIQAMYPEWPGFSQPGASTRSSRESSIGYEGTEEGHLDAEPEYGSSTGTTPTMGSPAQSPSTSRALMATIPAVAASPGGSCLPLPPPPSSLALSSPLAVGRSL